MGIDFVTCIQVIHFLKYCIHIHAFRLCPSIYTSLIAIMVFLICYSYLSCLHISSILIMFTAVKDFLRWKFSTFFFLPHSHRSLVSCVNNLFHITSMTLCVCRCPRGIGTISAYPPDSLKPFSYHYSSCYCSTHCVYPTLCLLFVLLQIELKHWVNSIPLQMFSLMSQREISNVW